ncbi:hypothetical protein [Chryseobacterium indoltheticum]|uniref:hypothetical protein n=1 Tax=Chryseobacterium indoltheticum TaxID=254 RepID=UPI003F496E6D
MTQQYNILIGKMTISQIKESEEVSKPVKEHVKSLYTPEQINEVVQNLKVFENKKQYLRKNIKLPEVCSIDRLKPHYAFIEAAHEKRESVSR